MSESKHELVEFLETKYTNLFNFVDKLQVYPYSFVIRESEMNCYYEIHNALQSIIKCVVQNYHIDKRIQDIYQFPEKIKRILDLYKDIPYLNTGALRPDFLYDDKTGIVKLCEINARFPTNGYLITLFGNEFHSNKNASSKLLPTIRKFLEDYNYYFDFNMPVCVLKGKEYGYDINLLKQFFGNIYYLNPKNLKFEKDKIFFYSNKNQKIFAHQFILELHQDEIINIPRKILIYLIQSCKLLNDLRTIFLIHDKRFLHLLSRDDILFDYMNLNTHKIIRKHRINTILSSQIFNNYSEIEKNKHKWLLKPAFLGKCKGIVLGKNINQEKWKHKLNNLKQNYVIQEYIDQKIFFLKDLKSYHLVGTLLCFNDMFYCPGIFRASKKDLVSLSQVGLIVYPSIQPDMLVKISNTPSVFKNHKPFLINQDSFYLVESFSFKDADLYLNSLLKYGFVLLELKFEDIDSNYLMTLLQSLNMHPRSHGNKDRDYVWHIKPLSTDPTSPRSHSDEIFQMHTDASYGASPPKYFALQCMHSDRLNGGQNLVVKLQDIVKELTPCEIDLLTSVDVKIKIPQEFNQKEQKNSPHDYIYGSILYREFGKIFVRYRHDIIQNLDELSKEYLKAFRKFEKLINLEQSNLINYFRMSDKQILMMDNSQFLHGRTKIFDKERHFVRIRFDKANN